MSALLPNTDHIADIRLEPINIACIVTTTKPSTMVTDLPSIRGILSNNGLNVSTQQEQDAVQQQVSDNSSLSSHQWKQSNTKPGAATVAVRGNIFTINRAVPKPSKLGRISLNLAPNVYSNRSGRTERAARLVPSVGRYRGGMANENIDASMSARKPKTSNYQPPSPRWRRTQNRVCASDLKQRSVKTGQGYIRGELVCGEKLNQNSKTVVSEISNHTKLDSKQNLDDV